MNFEKSMKFPFKGDTWVTKLLIAAGLTLTGIGAVLIIGYGLEIMREMYNSKSDDLEPPEWSNIGENLTDALKLIVVMLVWALPILVISGAFTIVIAIFSSAATDSSGEAIAFIITILTVLFTGATSLYGVLISGYIPTVMGEVATKQTIKAGLDFKNIFKLTKGHFWRNLGLYLIASIAGSLVTSLSTILCGIGVFAGAAYSNAFMFHLFGQSYLKITE